MIGRPTLRAVIVTVALVAAWCGLWGSVSIANVLGGLAVSVVVLASGLGPGTDGGIRFAPLLQLTWLVLVDLAASTANVAWEVLTKTDHTEEAIVAVETPIGSRAHMLVLVVAITLTPGTAVVDAKGADEHGPGTLYLHLLHVDRREATAEHVRKLARLACAALPVPDADNTGQPRDVIR